ncbi:YceI family protein [Corynebacterium kutscheri]|uniref:YceI family protein n=1 Tax=Corynebacterium kutscheri TaxID=35755 RepID=UPI0037BF57B6
MDKKRTIVIFGGISLIVVLSLFALFTVLYPLLTGPGVKTEELDASNAKPATTDINGQWSVIYGSAPNISSVGFTFHEILPSDKRVTSGSTRSVTGAIKVENETLTAGRVVVDMAETGTDQEKRDINVRSKIFETDKYPEATFEISEKVDLSAVPDDASVSEVVVPGILTIHGESNPVEPKFKVVRSGERLIISTSIHINRLDYKVETPEFVAAKIDEEGDINVLLTLAK